MLFLAEVGTMDLKVNRIATLGHMHTVRRESEGVCVWPRGTGFCLPEIPPKKPLRANERTIRGYVFIFNPD